MAITTKGELETAVANWIGKADLTSRIPEFIALAEARLSRLIVRHHMGEAAQAAIVASTEWISLPTDYGAMRALFRDGATQVQLGYKPADRLIADSPSTAVGAPRWFTLHGGSIQLRPIPDGDYTLLLYYYATVPALTTSGSTNAWLTSYPDLYLYACLMEASPYVGAHQDVSLWAAAYDRAVADAVAYDRERQLGGTPLRPTAAVRWVRGL